MRIRAQSRNRKAKMAVETPANCFRGISKNYDPSTRRCVTLPPPFPPFFFPSHFVPLRSIERAVVTFEICWEEEKVLGSKGRMILNNV